MTQHDLNRAVAKATGESVEVIRDMGFGLMPMLTPAQRSASRLHRLHRYAGTHHSRRFRSRPVHAAQAS